MPIAAECRALALVLLMLVAPLAGAVPAVSLSGGNFLTTGNSLNNQAQTQGWEFRATTDIRVTALGLFDANQDGLADPHDIGLWDAAGNLLFSTTIPEGTGTALVGLFRYLDIVPLVLAGAQNYVIGAFYTGIQGGGALDPDPGDRDAFHGIGSNSLRTFAPGIEFVDPRISSQQTSGLLFPTVQSLSGLQAILGPNFLFEAAVPAPGVLLLLVAGALGLVRARVRA